MTAFLTIAQICERTGFTRQFVSREMRRGNLKFGKVGRRVRVSHFWFNQWASGKQNSEEVEPSNAESDQQTGDAEILAAMERLEIRMSEIGEDIAKIKAAFVAREARLRESLP
ncbi:hypothetical protein [Agrobacterium larrymoorei]|uniref:hypothetical protein n=1 Tax=Agrobacterium larrymoorei TaxID=160699 RepID=UPI0030C2187E